MINVEEARYITDHGGWKRKAMRKAERKIIAHAKKGIRAAAVYFKKEEKALWMRDELRKNGFDADAYGMPNRKTMVRVLWR